MNRLQELRLKRGETQQDIAGHLALTRKAISFYELGQRDIPNDVLIKLAKHFHTTTDYILGLTDSDIIQEVASSENKRRIFEALKTMSNEEAADVAGYISFKRYQKSQPKMELLLGHDPFK